MSEVSGSSLDGELDNFSGSLKETVAYFDSYSSFDQSPSKNSFHDSLDRIQHSEFNVKVSDGEEDHSEHMQETSSQSPLLNDVTMENSNSNINPCDLYIPACMKINKILHSHGLTAIPLSSGDIDLESRSVSVYILDAWAESILSSVEEVLERQKKQADVAKSVAYSAKTSDVSKEALEAHIRDLQRKLSNLESKNSSKLAERSVLEESFSKIESDLKSSDNESKKKIKNLENLLKESDRKLKIMGLESEKMREKLQVLVEKDRVSKSRYSQLLNGSDVSVVVKGVKASPKNSGIRIGSNAKIPTSPEDLVKALDMQRIELEQQNEELREQVKELSSTIKDMKNRGRVVTNSTLHRESNGSDTIIQSSQNQSGIEDVEIVDDAERFSYDRGVSGSTKIMFGKIKDQQRRIEQLVHREGVLQAENRRCEEALDVYRTRSSEMMEEIENLRIELDSRPTVRAFAQKQREVVELESKLHDVIMMRKEAAEVASWRKHLSTSDRIKADRRNHQLGLWIIESIPTAVVKEVLQSACRELDISDISELQPSIVKLKAVVKTVPRLEMFITRICSFVFDRQAPRFAEGDVKPDPVIEDALPIVKQWWNQVCRNSELLNFQESVLRELDKRERILNAMGPRGAGSDEADGAPRQFKQSREDDDFPTDAPAWMSRDPEVAIEIIKDVITFQLESYQNSSNYKAASDYISQNPEMLTNRLLSHIQYVFDIKDIQGLIPKMNQIYLFVEESRNFMSSLREAFGMENAQTSTIISETLRRLSAGTKLSSK